MRSHNRKTLAVIGAGPKGLAVAVKAKVLEEFGFPVSRVVLIEKNGVAANWSGNFGYTNGEMKLGTSPEKDVVFPLETDVGDDRTNARARQRLLQFTWTSFLVQTSRYSDWVDRGRPAPCHQGWAAYLQWVAAQLEPQASIVKGKVTCIDFPADGAQWKLKLSDSIEESLVADELMLTGPGKTRMDFVQKDNGRVPSGIYDLESFWAALKMREFSPTGKIAIVGTGENAASVLLALSQYAPALRVDLISPKGFIFTRAENFYENQVYSQPERSRWIEMEYSERVGFIERTDLGVFSGHAMAILNEQVLHRTVPGRVRRLERGQSDPLTMQLEYGGRTSSRSYDQVILATGFDQMSLLQSILSPRAQLHLNETLGMISDQTHLASLIQKDLSVEGLTPRLYLPMLAGIMQGPGFGNLSCLGRLSDRIVGSFAHMQESKERMKTHLALSEASL